MTTIRRKQLGGEIELPPSIQPNTWRALIFILYDIYDLPVSKLATLASPIWEHGLEIGLRGDRLFNYVLNQVTNYLELKYIHK